MDAASEREREREKLKYWNTTWGPPTAEVFLSQTDRLTQHLLCSHCKPYQQRGYSSSGM